jgi:hypothetical protein
VSIGSCSSSLLHFMLEQKHCLRYHHPFRTTITRARETAREKRSPRGNNFESNYGAAREGCLYWTSCDVACGVVGHRKEVNDDRYLLQNWWNSKPFVEVDAQYLESCGAVIHFVKTPQHAM